MYYIGEGCEIMKDRFELVSEYKPSGDQPEAIKELVSGLKEDKKVSSIAGGYRNWKNIYHFKCNCSSESTNLSLCTQ